MRNMDNLPHASGILPRMSDRQRETLLDFFASFADSPQDFLLHYDGYRTGRFTYRDVASAARAFASRLHTYGINQGERVLFWGENRPEWVVALWGCLLARVVVVPVDYRASSDLLRRVQSVANAKLLLTGDEVSAATLDDIPVWPFSSIEWTAAGFTPEPVSRDDVAEILFTSGAT